MPDPHSRKSKVMEASVTSPYPLAADAGARVLRTGGTALDAAIVVGAANSVVYPHFVALAVTRSGWWPIKFKDRETPAVEKEPYGNCQKMPVSLDKYSALETSKICGLTIFSPRARVRMGLPTGTG